MAELEASADNRLSFVISALQGQIDVVCCGIVNTNEWVETAQNVSGYFFVSLFR